MTSLLHLLLALPAAAVSWSPLAIPWQSPLALPWQLFAQATGNKTWGISWAIVLLCIVLGLMVTLRPAKRKSEVKRGR